MKKLFLLGVLFLFVSSSFAVEFEVDGIAYNITSYTESYTVEVTSKLPKYEGDIIIPNQVQYRNQMYAVTSIDKQAFYGCSILTSIEIPNSITKFEAYAFSYCVSLTSIEIPNSVTSIGDSTFFYCSSLTSIEIPNSVASIGDALFSECSSLSSAQIPNSVTSIQGGAFYGCSSLKSVIIPNSVTSIERGAFYGCKSLVSIEIPNSVTSIGDVAFYGCSSLTTIEVSSDNTHYTSLDGVLYSKDKSVLIQYPLGRKGLFEIPNSVTCIGYYAFAGCSGLTSMIITNSVTRIEEGAFSNCENLTAIVIPNSVASIGEFAFSTCSSLASIEIPNSVTSLNNGMFYNCTNLTSIVIPNSVTTICSSAFLFCRSLASIVLPNSVTSIGDMAFMCCTNLSSITLPNSVKSIGVYAFSKCTRLKTLVLPSSLSSIAQALFNECDSLCSIVIPNSVTSIVYEAFSDCSSLNSVVIPNSVTRIEAAAFENCFSLTKICCYSNIPPELIGSVFINDNCSGIVVYVPYNSVSLYKQAYGWKEFKILPLPPIIGSGENLVSGRVYMDANANGKTDGNERGISQQKILILPDSVYALTDNAGSYTFRCDTGSYQIQLVLPENWQATTATQYDVAVRTADTSGFDFGMAATSEESRSEVSIASLDGGRCFEPAPVFLTYNNTGTSIESGWLKYYPDSQFGAILKSVPAYDSLSAESSIVFWKMSNVMPFEQRNIMLQMQMPDFTAMGDTLVSALAFEDKASVQYTDTAQMVVRCSYDPNDKQVSPAGVQEEHFVLMSDPLEFTIRFQNTGNDVANRVVILDTLSQHLDLATFAVIASSHSVKTNRNNEGAVEFRFDNILLPDSTTNEPASHGFVKYRIKAKTGLPDSTVVENTSHIFFDYNPAVVTNTTAITMTYKIPKKEVPTTEDTTSNVSQSSKFGKALASIHPNPFSKTALLEFDNPNKDVFELQITDVAGKTQQAIKSTGNLIVIERGAMTEGLYFFTLRNTANGLVYNGNFVVE